MKEQVAEILGNMAHEVKQCGSKDPALGLAIKQATLQICQLLGDDKEKELMFNPDWTPDIQAMLKEFNESVETIKLECQERVERIFKEIEKISNNPICKYKTNYVCLYKKGLQALKKKELK